MRIFVTGAGGQVGRELVELCLDRIARHDARLNSFRVVFAERARMEAEQAETSQESNSAAPQQAVRRHGSAKPLV